MKELQLVPDLCYGQRKEEKELHIIGVGWEIYVTAQKLKSNHMKKSLWGIKISIEQNRAVCTDIVRSYVC